MLMLYLKNHQYQGHCKKTKTMSPEVLEKVDQNVGINKGETSVSQQKDQISQGGMEPTIDISIKPNKIRSTSAVDPQHWKVRE